MNLEKMTRNLYINLKLVLVCNNSTERTAGARNLVEVSKERSWSVDVQSKEKNTKSLIGSAEITILCKFLKCL